MDLDSMKYVELRSIAKALGLKANMKADKLLKAIKQYYQQENNNEEEEQGQERDVKEDETATQASVEDNKDASYKEKVPSPAVFVNARRGKGKGAKRKKSDTATVTQSDASLPASAVEGDTEVAESSAPCGAKGAKKRKVSVSPAKDSDKTETESPEDTSCEQQPHIKDEAPVRGDTEKAARVARAGKIPRYQGQQRNKPLLKPTPNFKKLHEAHFNKMKSIDSYVQRKIESFRSSVKELKKLSEKTKLQQADGKTQVKANQSRASMFSRVPVNKRPATDKRRNTVLSAGKAPASKSTGKEDAPFRQSVLSTRRINVRFSEATQDNEYKKSLVKTPARMSLCMASSTLQKQTTDGGKPNNGKTSTFSATNKGVFVFIGNTSTTTAGTQKKPNFDLKASLSRPLAYKPHTGKLKPFGETKENPAGNKSLTSNSHQKNYKQHQVQTREDRRAKHVEDRKQKKESALRARRGLVMM